MLYNLKGRTNKISYKWKIFWALLLNFLIPVILLSAGVPTQLVIAAGVLIVLSLTAFCVDRFTEITQSLESIISRLSGRNVELTKKGAADDLGQVITSLDGLVSSLETSYAKAEKDKKKKNKATTELPKVRTSYQAHLSTGQSVSGEIYVLPSREVDASTLSFSLTRREGLFLFHRAIPEVKSQLKELQSASFLGTQEKGIIDFQLRLIEDPSLTEGVSQCLEKGMTLHGALDTTFGAFMSRLQRSKNDYIRARSQDIMDLMYRFQHAIQSKVGADLSSLYQDAKDKIVYSDQIYPSEIINLNKVGVRGIVSREGTGSSHAQILMQSFNLSSVSDLDIELEMFNGTQVMLETGRRQLIVNPTVEDSKRTEHQAVQFDGDIITDQVSLASGEEMVVSATINIPAMTEFAIKAGADTVGLFRTEMSFIGRESLPTEDELYDEYRVIAEGFKDKPVIMRMLDLGSDKLPSFHALHHEENPCMGNRSMRLLLKQPDLFEKQLRAMLRAANARTTIIFPMISGWHELNLISKMANEILEQLTPDEAPYARSVKWGLMVEVPSIVERFEDYVEDFAHFNLGTNDLVQYTLAADRNNMEVAEYYNACHPSVLSMIHKVCRLAAAKKKSVCLCGEMAAQPQLLPLLVGLGVRDVSVSPSLIPMIKHQLQELNMDDCRRLAEDALYCKSADEVEDLVIKFQGSLESFVASQAQDTAKDSAPSPAV